MQLKAKWKMSTGDDGDNDDVDDDVLHAEVNKINKQISASFLKGSWTGVKSWNGMRQ